jgi:hypothetical protein
LVSTSILPREESSPNSVGIVPTRLLEYMEIVRREESSPSSVGKDPEIAKLLNVNWVTSLLVQVTPVQPHISVVGYPDTSHAHSLYPFTVAILVAATIAHTPISLEFSGAIEGWPDGWPDGCPDGWPDGCPDGCELGVGVGTPFAWLS